MKCSKDLMPKPSEAVIITYCSTFPFHSIRNRRNRWYSSSIWDDNDNLLLHDVAPLLRESTALALPLVHLCVRVRSRNCSFGCGSRFALLAAAVTSVVALSVCRNGFVVVIAVANGLALLCDFTDVREFVARSQVLTLARSVGGVEVWGQLVLAEGM